MGLLTGFSILSGVEIVYYLLRFIYALILSLDFNPLTKFLIRFFMSLRVPRAGMVSATKQRFENNLKTET